MTEFEASQAIALQAFAARFQSEKLGIVYYAHGLGAGGYVVTPEENIDLVDRYRDLLLRNTLWLKNAGKHLLVAAPLAMIMAFQSVTLAGLLLGLGLALYFGLSINALFGPDLFKRRLAYSLRNRILTKPLNHAERISRGYAWPVWKNLLFYFAGVPLVLFLLLHRAGPHGVVAILGPDLAQKYDFAITAVLVLALAALPYLWWKDRRKKRERSPSR